MAAEETQGKLPLQGHSTDPKNGYCSATKTFHSLRTPVPLPPLSEPLSIIRFTLSLLQSRKISTSDLLDATKFIIDSATGNYLTYSQFLHQFNSLASSLLHSLPLRPSLSGSANQVAFILAPPSIHIPVLYFSLLSLNISVSPANPLATPSEIAHMVQLCKPSIAFATSTTAHKLPPSLLTVFIDSPEFLSMLTGRSRTTTAADNVVVDQTDTAAILYSSGTTGKVKGVELTHRNLIAIIAGLNRNKYSNDDGAGAAAEEEEAQPVSLFTLPLFHVFGFFMLLRAASMGECLVLMERFEFEKMLAAIEKYKVTYMPVAPPLVVAMAKSDLVSTYNLSSLQLLGCGGAPLGKEVSERFTERFPNVEIVQGYGLTETGGGATGMIGPDESKHYGSAGRLAANTEAKIVDPETGEALPPGQRGELWLRGPMVMKGYIGDDEATAATLHPEGWLKTGDLCYFDSDGFLFVVDRLKELIKYKGYQVPPAELEHILQSHPDVADAAVIPYPDEEAGQIPMAYIVRKSGSSVNISENQVIDFVAKQVAPYKKIRRVVFISSIPKSPAGKILRRELVNHAISSASARL